MGNDNPIELIVFDCDGVILESVNIKTEAFGRVFEEFGPEAVQRGLEYHLANGGMSRYRKFAWFYKEFLGREIREEESRDMGERFTRYCYEGVLAAPFVPGAMEVIREWHGRIPMFVASGTPDEELVTIFVERDLSKYFKGVHGSPPGKTELLDDIVKKAGISAKRTLMVGDSSTDMDAAEAVGTRFYGRGESFKDTGWPWGPDLSGLSEYIRARVSGA